MDDHRHEAGEVMLSYRYMLMAMNGSLDGSESIDDAEIVSPDGYGFLVTPTEMTMQMHMFGVMYAPIDRVTLMGMLPILMNSMDTLHVGVMRSRRSPVGSATYEPAR